MGAGTLTYAATVEDGMVKLQYDLFYFESHSLLLDLMIFVEAI